MALLLAVFLFTLPLVVAVGNDDPASLPQAVWLQAAVPLFWIGRFAAGRTTEARRFSRFFMPVAALLAWAALSTLWAPDLFAAERVLFLWIAAAGLGVLVATTIESPMQAERLLLALFWPVWWCPASACCNTLPAGTAFLRPSRPPERWATRTSRPASWP